MPAHSPARGWGRLERPLRSSAFYWKRTQKMGRVSAATRERPSKGWPFGVSLASDSLLLDGVRLQRACSKAPEGAQPAPGVDFPMFLLILVRGKITLALR